MENLRPSSFIFYWLSICVTLVKLAPVTDDCDVYSTLVYRTERYCYAFVNQTVSWETAEKRCVIFGALLAKMDEHILTNTTVSAIANAFKIHKDVPVDMHVGFYKRTESAPVWLLDGGHVTIPDVDSETEGGGLLSIHHHGGNVNYTWILSPGTSELPYICQFDPHPLKVRLVNGPNPRAGRVEVYHFDAWGTVCDDLFDYRDAQVVCRMLDFPTDRAMALRDAFFGEGTGPILLDDLKCQGNETSLLQCPHTGFRFKNCQHKEDSGVVCLAPDTDECGMYSALLYRTERYCFAFMNSPVSWKVAESRCRTLGGVLAKVDEQILTNQTASGMTAAFKIRKDVRVHVHVGFNKISGNAPIWLLDGSEVTIPGVDWGAPGDGMLLIDHRGDSIQYMWFLYPNYDLRPYICQFDPQPLKVRLVNGPNQTAGRVEVYYFDTWGTVCDDRWDNLDAQVVCRMLGFPTDRAVAHRRAVFGKGAGWIHLNNVRCRGKEADLRHCLHSGPYKSKKITGSKYANPCGHSQDASVVCPDPSVGTTPNYLGGTTTAEPVGETTDVTVYGTTAVATYVNADTRLLTATTISDDGTTEDNRVGTTAVTVYVISDAPLISTKTSSAEKDNIGRAGDGNRAGTAKDSVQRTKLTRRTSKKPTGIRKGLAMTGRSVYIDGQALFESRCDMVIMCSRICISNDRCARLNYNQVTKDCRIFSKDAEVSYKTQPDWTVWEIIVSP